MIKETHPPNQISFRLTGNSPATKINIYIYILHMYTTIAICDLYMSSHRHLSHLLFAATHILYIVLEWHVCINIYTYSIGMMYIIYMLLQWESHSERHIVEYCSKWSETCRIAMKTKQKNVLGWHWTISPFASQSKCMCIMTHPQHHALGTSIQAKTVCQRKVNTVLDESVLYWIISFTHRYVFENQQSKLY